MLFHFFDRFYVVTKFELPKVEDLRLRMVQFDSKCSYLIAKKIIHNPIISLSSWHIVRKLYHM